MTVPAIARETQRIETDWHSDIQSLSTSAILRLPAPSSPLDYSHLALSEFKSRPPYPFLISGETNRSPVPHKINRAIGIPVNPESHNKNVTNALVNHDGGETATYDNPLAQHIAGWVEHSLVHHHSRYAPDCGFPSTREAISHDVGNNQYKDDEMTVVTGGVPKALEHIHAELDRLKAQGVGLSVVDMRGKKVGEVLEQVDAAWTNGNLIELTVENSAQLEEDDREALRKLSATGAVIIVDLVDGAIDAEKSLGRDAVVGNAVITVENSRTAQATHTVGIFGNKDLIAAVKDRALAVEGSPSTQMLFRDLITDILKNPDHADLKEMLLTLDEATYNNLPQTGNHTFMRDVMRMLHLAGRYIDSGDPQAQTEYRTFLTQQTALLEDRFKAYNKHIGIDLGAETVAGNGAARNGCVSAYRYARDHHNARVVLAPIPMWPYDDLMKVNDGEPADKRLEFDFFNETPADSMVFRAETTDGRVHTIHFDVDILISRMRQRAEKGERGVVQLFDGGHNPTAYIIPKEDKRRIVKAAAEYGFTIASDDTYLHETFNEEDKHTFAGVAQEMVDKGELDNLPVIVTTNTFTKDAAKASARVYLNSSSTQGFKEAMEAYRDVGEMNIASILATSSLLADPEVMRRIADNLRDEARRRVEQTKRAIDDMGRVRNDPMATLYVMGHHDVFSYPGKDPITTARLLASKYGVGVMPLVEAMSGNSDQWSGWFRMALAGPTPSDPDAYYHDTVELYRRADELLEEYKREALTA